MQDTSAEIRQKQLDIIFSKTESERLTMGLEMMEDMRGIIMSRIRLDNPGFSELDLKIEFVTRVYKNDFNAEEIREIALWFRTLALEQKLTS